MPRSRGDLLLLDVNVLLALAWPHHPFHPAAVRFMDRRQVWATCAATQLGFLRVSLNPALTHVPVTAAEALAHLAALAADPGHRYLAECPEPAGCPEAFGWVLGNRQVADAYLVKLAVHHGARLLTFDAKLRTVPGVLLLA